MIKPGNGTRDREGDIGIVPHILQKLHRTGCRRTKTGAALMKTGSI